MATSVIMVRPRMEPGGATEHITLLSRGLHEAGFKVLLATASREGLDALREAGVEILHARLAPSSPFHLLVGAAQLGRVVRRRKISVIHSHHRFGNLVGRLVSRLTGVPLVVTVHEFRYNQRWMGELISGDRTIAPSVALARHVESHYGFDPKRIVVIPNAIPLEGDAPGGMDSKAGYEGRDRGPVVGYIGRLSPEKGVRYFVQSIPIIAREHPGIKCLVFGNGPEENELRALTKQLNIGDATLSFRGWRPSLEAMGEVDILVIPSLKESFGYVALEAMRASLPIVATSAGGLLEIVADNESGLFVPPKDPAAIASAVCRLLKDPELRLRFGRRGREILEERFSLEHMVRSTMQVYESVVGHGLAS